MKLVLFVVLWSLLTIIHHANCQGCSTNNGLAEFYLGFVPNFGAQPSVLLLTGETGGVEYSIEARVTGYHRNDTFSSNLYLTLPRSLTGISYYYHNAHQNDYKEGIYIKINSKKVTVIGESVQGTIETFYSLPAEDLNVQEYIYYAISVPAYVRADTSVVMVGTENVTTLTLTPSQNAYIKINNIATWSQLTTGVVYSYQINRLDILYIAALGRDLSGTKIVASKPISVFSGHECAWIPSTVYPCDIIMEQMLPTELYGKVYYIAPLSSRNRYTVKIIAAESNTNCQLYCSTTQRSYSLNAGGYSTVILTNRDYCVIYSIKKILVVQFSHSYNEDNQGGPMMTLVPPKSHYTNFIKTSTIQRKIARDYINIIVSAEYHQPEAIYLTTGGANRSLESYSWVPIVRNSITEAYATQANVTRGVIQLFHSNKRALMTVVVYGFAHDEGYGHPGWLRSYTACPLLTTPNDGDITCSLGDDGIPSYEDTCSFTCNLGYELTGSITRTCHSDRSWSGTTTMCRRVQCTALVAPESGNIQCSLGDDGVPSYEDTCSFTCNTGYELTTSNTRTCHSDRSWSGTTTMCRRVRCPSLTAPNDGGITCLLGDDRVLSYKDTCSFTCNTGYELTGSIERACQSDRNWSGTTTMCRRVQCVTLAAPAPGSGNIQCSLGDDGVPSYEDTCNFTCNTGYELTGIDSRTCESDGSWNGTETTCRRVPCPSLTAPNGGDIDCSLGYDGISSYEDTCNFTCNTGYELTGSDSRTCQTNRLWSGATPMCTRVPCPALTAPNDGGINCILGSDGVPSYEDTCSFTCNIGYELTGSIIRNCQSDRNWSSTTTMCLRVQCAALATPESGNIHCSLGDDGVPSYEDTCSFTCNTGYELTGSNNRTCQSYRGWNGTEATCRRVPCPPPTALDNGDINCSLGDDGVHSYEDTCSFTCNTGYELTGSNTRTCQSNRLWNGTTTMCARVQCTTLVAPESGNIQCSLGDDEIPSYEDNCSFTCYTGYELTGNNSRACQSDGSWNGTETMCGRVPCPSFTAFNNGGITCSLGDDGVPSYEDTCSFTCDTGYVLTGSNSRTCQSDRAWSGSMTMCTRVQCTALAVPESGNIQCSLGDDGVPSYEDTCSFRCNTGYELTGSNTRTCQSYGSWNGTVTMCRRVPCQSLPTPSDGGITCSLGDDGLISYEDTCTFTCNIGYMLTGSNTRTCQSDTIWSGTTTICLRAMCTLLMVPDNGDVHCSLGGDGVISYEDTCNFTCNTGYELTGSNSRTCQSDMSWNGTETMCGRVPCPSLTAPNDGGINCSLRDNGVPSYEDTCSFTCNTGYELTGSESRICQSDRNWSGTITMCTRVQCAELTAPESGNMHCSLGEDGVASYIDTCNFTCNTGYELTGSGSRTCQSDMSWNGTETMCERVPCSSLADLNNGVYNCSLGDDGVSSYEDSCSFTCNTGYELTGSDSRTCQSDGSWNGTETMCTRVPCPSIATPNNGVINCSLGDDGVPSYEDTCSFRCDTGYELSGGNNRICQANSSWSGIMASCLRVSCPELVGPENGVISCLLGDDEVPSYEDTCNFTCNTGYELTGSGRRICQSDERWSGPMTLCSRVPCPPLTNPNDGAINCSLGDDGVPSYEDTCGFTCNTGYELTGSDTRTCQSDRNWSGTVAKCTRVPCPSLSYPDNGLITCSLEDDESSSYEDVCNFTCNTGFELTGSDNRTCLSNGSWSGMVTMCTRVPCASLTNPNDGEITCSLGDDEVSSYEDTCTFTCNAGYELTGSDTRTCQSDGSWSGTMTMCTRVPCPSLSSPNDGVINCTLGDDGVPSYEDTCSFTCNMGYELSGSDTRTCQNNGSWSNIVTVCTRVACPSLTAHNDGGITCSLGDDGVPSYEDTCSSTCNTGYELTGSDTRTCQSNGSWNGTEAMCTRAPCPSLTASNNGMITCSLGDDGVLSYEDTCSFTCNTGYELFGSDNRTCQSDGSWSEILTYCARVACPSLSNPINGGITCSLGDDGVPSYEDTCSFTCNTGYELTGNGSSFCQSDGSWSDYLAICTIVHCITLIDPDNGDIHCLLENDTIPSYEDTCSFTCNTGYELTVNDNRTCQSDGSWSGTEAMCTRVPCLLLTATNDGAINCSLEDDGVPSYEDNCSFMCNTGFMLVGSDHRTCQSNGNWSGTAAVCTRVPCPMLNYTENANSHCSLRNNTIPVYEDSCNFTCKTGFELSGSESRICQSDGSWSGTMTVCTRVPCPILNFTENVNFSCSLRDTEAPAYKDMCNFTCYTGFDLTGSNNRNCQSDGNWSGTMTVCTRVPCPSLTDPSNGVINCSLGDDGVPSYEDTCSFICNTGYELTGSDNRICQSDGSWSGSVIECTIVSCPPLTDPNNGLIDCLLRDSPNFTYEDTCSFTCNTGYELTGSNSRTCQSDRNWSGSITMCMRVLCTPITAPNNGVMSCLLGDDEVPSYEDTCSFTCNLGYEMTGSDARTCQSDGNWNGSITVCRRVQCPALNGPANGTINCLLGDDSVLSYEDTCSFTCYTGYQLIGSGRRTCESNRDWSGNMTTCTRIPCSSLINPDNGIITCILEEDGFVSSCSFMCDTGYELTGSDIRTCQMNGIWSGTLTNCRRVLCRSLTGPDNGNISCLLGDDEVPSYEDTCSFMCNAGYELTGSNITICQSNGSWSGSETVSCTQIPHIDASAQQIIVLEGDSVTLNCIPSSANLIINWSVDGNIVSGNGRYSLSPTNLNHTLTISSVNVFDNGLYRCEIVRSISQVSVNEEILLSVIHACGSEYSNGVIWPRHEVNQLARIRCSALHSSFRSGVFITRMCYSNGEWGDVDMSACTMRLGTFPLVMVETNSAEDDTLLMDEIATILEDGNYNILITTSTQSFPSNFQVILFTIIDGSIADEIISVISEEVTLPITFITVFQPSFNCSCNESIPLNNSVNIICIGPSVQPCVISDGRFICNNRTYTGNGEICGLDSDSDGYPDIQLDCTEPQCVMDAYPFVYSDVNTTEACTMHMDIQPGEICKAENDTVWNIAWPNTTVGSIATQKCPGFSESIGLAYRECLSDGVWSVSINITQCRNVELMILDENANEVESILRNITNNNTMDLTNYFEISDVQDISMELAMLTNTSDRPIVVNDLNTSNDVLSTLISITSLVSKEIEENTTIESLEPVIQNISSTINNLLSTSNTISFETAREAQLPVGEDLLQNVENFAVAIGDVLVATTSTNSTNKTSLTIERENAVFNAQLPPQKVELINGIVFPEVGDTQVTIPANAIIHQRNVEGSRIPVVNFIAKNLQHFLVKSDVPQGEDAESMIISSQISNGFIELPPNSTVMLKFDNFVNTTDATTFTCVYWDFDLMDINNQSVGGWSSEGIIQDNTPGLPVLCNTTHLTSFAVLVGTGGKPASFSLRIVSYFGCCISMVCLLMTATALICLRKRAFKGRVYVVHLNLTIALLIALLSFVSGVETAINNTLSCTFVTILLHYCFLVVFCWALCEGMMIYTMFATPFYKGFFQQTLFYLIVGWGLPLPIVLISAIVSHDNYGIYHDKKRLACWISNKDGAIWAFTAPMILIVLVNYFFLISSVYQIYKVRRYGQRNTGAAQESKLELARTVLMSILVLMPLLGGTWILGLLFLIDSDSEPLAWIFTILNSLQGFTIFFFHVLRNKEVIKYCRYTWTRVKTKRTNTMMSKDTLKLNIFMKATSTARTTFVKSNNEIETVLTNSEANHVDWTYPESNHAEWQPPPEWQPPAEWQHQSDWQPPFELQSPEEMLPNSIGADNEKLFRQMLDEIDAGDDAVDVFY